MQALKLKELLRCPQNVQTCRCIDFCEACSVQLVLTTPVCAGSKTSYGNKLYAGACKVHTLLTLGTPHTSADSITQKNLTFVNSHYPHMHEPDIRYGHTPVLRCDLNICWLTRH